MTSKLGNFFPGVNRVFYRGSSHELTAQISKLACEFIAEISGDLHGIRLAVLSSKGCRGMTKGTHLDRGRNNGFCGFHRAGEKENWEGCIFMHPLSERSTAFLTLPAILNREGVWVPFLRTGFNFCRLL